MKERKVRAAQGGVLPNGKAPRLVEETDSATENKLPAPMYSEREKVKW
jgi:hypothetical protein